MEQEVDWEACSPQRREVIAPLGVPLVVHEWGDPEADPIVLVHGFLDHGRGFEPIAPRLAEHFRVISYDARGHGDSGWCDGYAWSLDVGDLVEILRWVGRPSHLIGHSRGGGTALDAAIHAPDLVRKFVNVDGFGPPPEGFVKGAKAEPERNEADRAVSFLDVRRRARGEMRWRAYGDFRELVARRKSQNPRLGGTWLDHFVRVGCRKTEAGFVWKADPMVIRGFGPWKPDWIDRQWTHLEVPMLAVVGAEQDTWGPLPEEVLAARLGKVRDVDRVEVPGAGHFVHMEKPDFFLDLVRGWLTT